MPTPHASVSLSRSCTFRGGKGGRGGSRQAQRDAIQGESMGGINRNVAARLQISGHLGTLRLWRELIYFHASAMTTRHKRRLYR